MSDLLVHPDWLVEHEAELTSAYETVLELVAAAGNRSIVTSEHDGAESSTAVHAEAGTVTYIECEAVLVAVAIKTVQGIAYPLILRTFTDEVSHTLPNGVTIPVKVVRGWLFDGSDFVPLSEADMFNAHCTDASTGDPIPPEHGVRYADAWPLSKETP